MNWFRFFMAAACLLLLTHCASTPKKRPPTASTPQAQKEFNSAKKDALKEPSRAITKLTKFVAAYPDSDLTADAYILMGDLHYRRKQYATAYGAYVKVVEGEIASPRESEAFVGAGKSLARQNKHKEAVAIVQLGLERPGVNPQMAQELHKVRFFSYNELNNHLEALASLVRVAELEANESEKSAYKLRAQSLFETKIVGDDLERVGKQSQFGFIRPPALLKLATRAFESRDYSRAKSFAREAADLTDDASLKLRSEQMIQLLDARSEVSPKTIGAVLPLTGRQSKIAQRTLRGLQLGLGIYGENRSDFTLSVVDSEGHPDKARAAVERLINEDRAIAIVGSLLSRTAQAEAQTCNDLGVPHIALSQRAGLTELGQMTFRNSLSSEMLIQFLVKRAMERGLQRFAILYPDDAYGVEFSGAFWNAVTARGGQVVAVQKYKSGETDFSAPVRKLVGTYYKEDRSEENDLLVAEWKKKQKKIGPRTQIPDDLLPPVVAFDAIFVPDDVKALAQIGPTLQYNGINNVWLVGTNLWNDPALAGRDDKYLERTLFADASITVDTTWRNSKFFMEFKNTFNEEPTLFEAQAYDTGLILREAISRGERSRVGLMEALNTVKEFPGSLGRISTNSNRELERPLSLLTIKEGVINIAQ